MCRWVKRYGNYLATEKGTGRCVGFEGELPFRIEMGKVHHYMHLSKGAGNLVTVEFTDGIDETFNGAWIDPLDIKKVYS